MNCPEKPRAQSLPDLRKTALLSYRRGSGLTLDKIVRTPNCEDLFGSQNPSIVRRSIVETIASEPNERVLRALANALGIYEDHPDTMLTQRREGYAREHGHSMRTLVYYEEIGSIVAAQILPDFIELST